MRSIAGLILVLLLCSVARASHLRSGEIRITRVICTSLTFEITVIVYINLHSNVAVGGEGSTLSFGDGSSIVLPEIGDYEMVDEALAIGRVVFSVTHAYAADGDYIVSYSEANRNEGVVNMAGSVNTPFYVESKLVAQEHVCNSSPRMLVPPIDRACQGVTFYHNPAAVDPDGDSLSFALVVPRRSALNEVVGYRFPDDENLYTTAGIPYNGANEGGTGPPVFAIDPVDGTMTWDAPGLTGEYGIAFSITEWKFNAVDSTWFVAGVTVRDMQIIVEECANRKPALLNPADICVVAGENITFTLNATDPDSDPVSIEVFSDALDVPENAPSISPPGGTLQSTLSPHDTAHVTFRWATTCDLVRRHPYKVVFKIVDRPAAGPRLVRFYTMLIKIIAPAPEYKAVTVNPIAKTVALAWNDYQCADVTAFQVWRRISRINYEVPECTSGIPDFLKYELLAEVPSTETGYVDKNLSHGAQYCYRIVALTGATSMPSIVSLDTCLIPKPAEAPVITNVSVINTHNSSGSMLIRWTDPFQIDRDQYPPPYAYKVFRRPDAEPGVPFAAVSALLTDTVFTDSGLNTDSVSYRYRIQLYVPALTTAPVDTSSEASSVFLSAEPLLNAISLTWSGKTAWSNHDPENPYHLIFRKSPQSEFVLIDSVHIFEDDFHYIDRGQFQNTSLLLHTEYQYKVMTRGTYGNAAIAAPLENFSQVVVSETLDTIPPCAPALTLVKIDCSAYSCAPDSYYNVLEIADPDPGCSSDVVAYQIVVRGLGETTFSRLAVTGDNTYLHANLASLDICYAVVALDGAGNRSDTSAIVCSTSCTTFKLPNVITPGKRDDVNDQLMAFAAETSGTADCARAVKKVDVKIFNRWGQEVYRSIVTTGNNPILWAGVDNAGRAVSAGTYYYNAKVLFDTAEPTRQTQVVKGWVQVVR